MNNAGPRLRSTLQRPRQHPRFSPLPFHPGRTRTINPGDEPGMARDTYPLRALCYSGPKAFPRLNEIQIPSKGFLFLMKVFRRIYPRRHW